VTVQGFCGRNGCETSINLITSTIMDSYDAMGRPRAKRQQFYSSDLIESMTQEYTAQRTYDLAGHVKTQTYPSGHTVSYNYDAAGRLGDLDSTHLAFTGNLGDGVARTYAQGVSYNERSQLQLEKYGTTVPLYHKLRYNVRGQLYDVRLSTQSDIGGDWDRGCLQFFYSGNMVEGGSGTDNNGNVVAQKHWIPGVGMRQDNYTYDTLNRLSQMQEYMHGTDFLFQQVYNYDRFGNRTISPATTDGLPEPQYGVNTAKNQLTPGGAGTLTYDPAGNLTYDSFSPNTTWGGRTYDGENRMTAQYDTGGEPVSQYSYDGDGHRVRRTNSGVETWQVYGFDGELLAEYAANAAVSTPQKEYGYRSGELLITAEANATIQWLVADQLGTPRMVADLSGNLIGIKRHDYLPFGEEIGAGVGGRTTGQGYSQPDGVKQHFTSKLRDDETGLDYFGARYFSSSMGRFTSPDEFDGFGLIIAGTTTKVTPKVGPLPYADIWSPQSINKYHYTMNNPLKFVDPDGHGYKRVEERDQHGKQIVRYEWVNDNKVHDVPNNFAYADTQGRIIQLYGDDKTNFHSWGVVEPDKDVVSDQNGNGPASYRNWGDTAKALTNAGYQIFYDPNFEHAGGFDFAKKSGPTLHITVFLNECCKGNFGRPWADDAVQQISVHEDRISPVGNPGKHIFLETIPQMLKPMRPLIDPRGPITIFDEEER
jgi:RHS repeat-associated protein